MPAKIVLLGKEEKRFHFVQHSLTSKDYEFVFVGIEKAGQLLANIATAGLIIIDTVPFPERYFTNFCFLKENKSLSSIPILALVKEQPSRLRYRLIQLGITDYLTVPFDVLDIRVRVKNLLQTYNRNGISPPPAVEAFQSFTDIYRELNKSFFSLKEERFNEIVLTSLQKLCDAHNALLFNVLDDEKIELKFVQPKSLSSNELILDASEIPALEKALRLQEPTVLNMATPNNPFVFQLKAYFNLDIKSFIIYPISLQQRTRSILCILKSDEEALNDYHYLLVQHFAQFIVHFFYLNLLRKEVEGHMDGQIWQFYFEFLDQVVNQLSFGILVVGKDKRVKYLNENAAGLLNVSPKDVLYHPVLEILSEETVNKVIGSVDNSPLGDDRQEIKLKSANDKVISVGFSVREFTDELNEEQGYIISFKDITESKKIQEEMRRVDRLASLGVMMSGIAHEIRNPLAGIKAMAQTFEEELTAGDPKNEYVQRIVKQVNRLDGLLRTLFSYAKPQKPNRKFCQIETVLNDVISLIRQKFREHNITLTKLLHPRLPDVFVDPSQTQQVLVNLILNSIEAITKDGEITISIQPFSRKAETPPPPHATYTLPGKQYLEVKIQDNGCGISKEDLKHIFNPFFTTKTFGTGLGLSIVYQIVKENAGSIVYESEVDNGTICYLYLPAEKIS